MRSVARTRNLLVAVLAVALVLAVSAAPAVAKSSAKHDKKIARQGLLTIDDFSTGDWTSSPYKSSKTGLAECKAIEKASDKNKKYKTDSPDFTDSSTGARAQNTIFMFPKAAQASAFLKTYKSAQAIPCLQATIKKALKGTPGADAAVAPIDLSSAIQPGVIDEALGYAVRVTITDGGSTQVQWLDIIALRSGRTFDGFTTQNADEQLPIIQDLIGASIGRLSQALKA